MKLDTLFLKNRPVYSFELFPPKADSDIGVLYDTLAELKTLAPDYLSITYGAGGSSVDFRTADLAALIKSKYGIEPLAHLTCAHSSKADIDAYLERLREGSVQNVLALRGDLREGVPRSRDFTYASDLVSYLASAHPDFNVVGACYPEGHFEAPSLVADIRNLKKKVAAGVTHLNSQLFFDNTEFYSFLEKLSLAGIDIPVEAGIMPIVKRSQIERTIALAGPKLPAKFSRMVARYGDNPSAFFDAGIAYATEQIVDLLSYGVRGIHLYIMNNATVARKITQNISALLNRNDSPAT